ncbi:MAG: glutathione ABC transporter substrate-binding protein [Armatimonadota bacterium]|nr:glutathione ABC transporter substrate-binding protein [Armatimonadota bacterium]
MRVVRMLALLGLGIVLAAGGVQTTGAAPAPQHGGTLVFAQGIPVITTDPGIAGGTPVQTVRKAMYESLVVMDEEGNIKPQLATSWSLSDDKKTWTFRLRRNVRFHDGTTFNAAAVKATFDRLLDPAQGLPRRNEFQWIKSIETPDDLTVQFVTTFPYGPTLRTLAMDSASIISPAAIRRYGKDIGWNPVGTGPYKYESHVPEQSVTLVRFDDYWGGRPYLDRLIFRTVREDATRVAMLEAGEAQLITNVPGTEVARLQGDARLKIRLDPSTRVAHIGMSLLKAPFNNVKVRQALNHAVHRAAIVRGVLRDIGIPVQTVLSPATWGYSDPGLYPYDTDRAKRLLAEAGYPNGFQTVLWTPDGRYFMDRQTAVAVQGQLALVGVQADVRVIDWATYLQILRRPQDSNETQMYLLGWESGTADPAILVNTVFNSASVPPTAWNTMFYKNPKVDELIAAGAQETDTRKRAQIYAELQKTIMTDAPWIPLFAYKQTTGLRANVEGLQVLPTEVHLLRDVWLRR